MDEQDYQQRPFALMSDEELQALVDNQSTRFAVRVDAVHALLRREARNAPAASAPFLDGRQLRIDPSEYLRSALAL